MKLIINTLIKLGIRKHDLDYHFIRTSMVVISCSLDIRSGSNMRRRH
jgi:hypothetical protein